MVDDKAESEEIQTNGIQDKRTQKRSFGVGVMCLLHDSKHASGASVLTNLMYSAS